MPETGAWVKGLFGITTLLDVDATRLARDRTLLGHALEANPEASLHLEDGERAVILEGRVGKTTPDAALAATLAAQANAKYEWADAPDSAYQAESLIFRPRKAMAWTLLYKDATRFTFDEQAPAPSRT